MEWVRPHIEETLQGVDRRIPLFFAASLVTLGGLKATGVLELLANSVSGLADLDARWPTADDRDLPGGGALFALFFSWMKTP